MIVHSPYAEPVVRESRLDAAISRGFDPHEPDDLAPRPLDGAWLAAFDASVAQAKALRAEAAAR
jgi:hypothetical protein